MKSFKVSPPWIEYRRKLQALFEPDPEIVIDCSEDELEIKFYVDNEKKAAALSNLLPEVKTFGNVEFKTTIVPSNGEWKAKLLKDAFQGNHIFKDIQIVEGAFDNPICYVVFKKEVVQYFNDNLGDIHGIESTLYQNIAQEILEIEGVYYCTDTDVESETGGETNEKIY